MFEKAFLDKRKLEVDLQLATGDQYQGFLFLGQEERLSDLLNDSRQFLPFEVKGGGTIIIGKQTIVEIVPSSGEVAGLDRITDQSDAMSHDVARKILALPKNHTRQMIMDRTQALVEALEATDVNYEYVITAAKAAAEELDGFLKMNELES